MSAIMSNLEIMFNCHKKLELSEVSLARLLIIILGYPVKYGHFLPGVVNLDYKSAEVYLLGKGNKDAFVPNKATLHLCITQKQWGDIESILLKEFERHGPPS